MPTPDIVIATGVTKGFAASGGRGRTEAVRGVDLVVGRAELVVLLGRSGAGKSTLLSLVGGIDVPDAGTILVAGHDVGRLHGRAREEYLRNTVGWVFSSAGLLPLLSALENVWLAARLPPCLRTRRWRGRSMRRRLNISAASGDDSCPLDPPVVIPRSLPADCSPESDALELSSVADSDSAWLSESWGSEASESLGLEPSWSSARSGLVDSSSSRCSGLRARCASASVAAS